MLCEKETWKQAKAGTEARKGFRLCRMKSWSPEIKNQKPLEGESERPEYGTREESTKGINLNNTEEKNSEMAPARAGGLTPSKEGRPKLRGGDGMLMEKKRETR